MDIYLRVVRQYLVMGANDDGNVLDGPRTPYWGCSKCGSAYNYASRIKCRCGAVPATSIVQAAKRNAAAALLHPKVSSKSKGGPKVADKRDNELAVLRAEVTKLRLDGMAVRQPESDETMVDDPAEVDIDKVQIAHTAVVAAFGAESKQARELSAELEGMRHARRESRPLSVQLRAAERQVVQKKKVVANAKIVGVAAEEAARSAQLALKQATDRIAACEKILRGAEEVV